MSGRTVHLSGPLESGLDLMSYPVRDSLGEIFPLESEKSDANSVDKLEIKIIELEYDPQPT